MAYENPSFKVSNTINFAAKMDDRTNSEILDLDTTNQGFVFTYLQNADLFHTKALSIRPGTSDIGGGIINTSGYATVFNYYGLPTVISGTLPVVTVTNNTTLPFSSDTTAHVGMIIIPTGTLNIINGQFDMLMESNNNPYASSIDPQLLYNINCTVSLYTMDQTPSGLFGMVGTSGNIFGTNLSHSIAYNGNYNTTTALPSITNPFPTSGLNGQGSPFGTSLVATASCPSTNFGNNFQFVGTTYRTPIQTIPYSFTAPVVLNTGNVYFLQIEPHLTSGNKTRTFGISYNANQYENGINTIGGYSDLLLINGAGYGVGIIGNQTNPIAPKPQTTMLVNKYVKPLYILAEHASANYDLAAPLFTGIDSNGFQSPAKFYSNTFNGAISTPPVNTQTVPFGQLINVPAGTHTIYGTFFYVAPNDRPDFNKFSVQGSSLSGYGYNLNYVTNISQIITSGGSLNNGNYRTTSLNPIATQTGSYTFSYTTNNYISTISDEITSARTPAYGLNKIITMFQNPVTITNTANADYLLSFSLLNSGLTSGLTDYSYYTLPGTSTTEFQSFLMLGFNTVANPSGSFLINQANDNTIFSQPASGSLVWTPTQNINLSCGIISVPSGNAVTSIYDYRVGGNRTQRIISTIEDKVQYNTLGSTNYTTIWTGAAISNNYKWAHTTFQDMLFSHQYSQYSGLCWDQIYSNPSGFNSMQYHGQRPAFATTVISGIQSIYSGVQYGISGTYSVNVMLATQMGTGGIRASNFQTVQLSGNQNYIRLTGPSGVTNPWFGNSIFNPSGYPIESQYAMDVLPQATYVFVSQPSGNIFYLADLMNYPNPTNPGFQLLPNPLPNQNSFNISGVPVTLSNPTINGVVGNLTGLYIGDVSANSLQQQIPNITFYDQNYLNEQIDTPKFKKLVVFYNYLLGIGDPNNPSAIWYSQIQAPEIWGTDGDFCGNVSIDPDNGSPITGFAVFKTWMIVFKYNSTYRIDFTGLEQTPFAVSNISATIGNLGFFTPVTTDYGVFFLSQFGPALATYQGVDSCGDEILPFFQTLSESDLTFSTAIHDRSRQQIYWSITDNSTNSPQNLGLTYSYVEKAWTVRQNGLWNVEGVIGDNDNFNLLYIGDPLGQIQQISDGSMVDVAFNDGLGNQAIIPIEFTATTPWLSVGDAQHLKQLRSLRLNCDTAAEQLLINVYYDQNDNLIQYSRILDMNQPVINRAISLAGTCRTVKFVVTTINGSVPVKLKSMQVSYRDLGLRSNI